MSARRTVRVGGPLLAVALFAGAAAPDGNPLLDAVRRGDVAAVRSLLRDGADPNAAQGDGLTALHVAAQKGSLGIARLLLDAGAAAHAKTRIGGYTPLHLAAQGAHTALVGALLEAGADPAAVTTTSGVTPLHLAAGAVGGEATVRVLLEHGAPADARESAAGQTPLMFAASQGRAPSAVVLLAGGPDPGVRTEIDDVADGMGLVTLVGA